MSSVRFVNGTTAKIEATAYVDGNLYCSTDNDLLAYDLKGERHWVKGVLYNSTANWNLNPSFVPAAGQIIVYSDYAVDEDNTPIPGIKVGDGAAYGVDLPFITTKYDQLLEDFHTHATNADIHLSASERKFLTENAVACKCEGEVLSFSTFGN